MLASRKIKASGEKIPGYVLASAGFVISLAWQETESV
jgi:hypothetical protein